jgi:hypothetical protein
MKKVVSALVLASLMLPAMALAQTPSTGCTITHSEVGGLTGCPSSGACDFATNPICGACCVLEAVYTVADWIFFALVAMVALLVIWGGFTIATAGGAPDKVGQGRNFILYAMIGLALALLSRAIPALVRALIS